MKLTLEHKENKQTVTVEAEGVESILEVMDTLVVPALLALTFHHSTIKKGLEYALEELLDG